MRGIDNTIMKKNQRRTFARRLRQQQTEAERTLWAGLRNRQLQGVKFRRQQPIGPYIIDFVSFDNKLIVEVDGAHHGEQEIRKGDTDRAEMLRSMGYRVLRFWDNEVLSNTDSVIEEIRQNLE